MIRAALLSGAAMAAAPSGAHDIDDPRLELFVAILSQHGCEMTQAVAEVELPKYGFTRQEARAFAADLVAHDRARVDYARDSVKLHEETCF